MQGDDGHDSSLALHHPRLRHTTTTIPYSSSSVATCASASAISIWSNGSTDSSQSSVDDATFDCPSTVSSQTSVSSVSSNGSACLIQQNTEAKLAAARSWQSQQQQLRQLQQLQQLQLKQQQQLQQKQTAVAAQLRQHPRRSSAAPAVVPSLLRQSDRRTTFVDHLVDASTQIVQAIWPLSSVIGRGESGNSSSNGSYLLPLRTFIQETLRRSRASYSTLQVALYYLLLIKPRLPSQNFTMEQSHDSHGCRALQCGRRMFLASLILASKYLQDRNYSARAWSKISGLSTAEINQNETAFLHAVNWRLHITNEVYNRWIECVNKFNSPQLPPSPGPAVVDGFERKCFEFRMLIQKLSPSLENLDELCGPTMPAIVRRSSSCQIIAGALSPVSMCSSPEATGIADNSVSPSSNDSTPLASKLTCAPMSGVITSAMECSPSPVATSFASGRAAPALGLLPTPKLAPPQANIFNCGATNGSSVQMLAGGRSSMCFAVAQASNACANQLLDRWMPSLSATSTSSMSPAGCALTRRSSLANSVSTASSPESMISDSSLVSRSSSVASAWSAVNAPNPQLSKLDIQARYRYVKQQCSGSGLRDKSSYSLRPTLIPAMVPEDHEASDDCGSTIFASPETIYTGPVGKDALLSMAAPELSFPSALACRRSSEIDATDAAQALAELQQQHCGSASFDGSNPKAGLKRSRPVSVEASALQDNVRDLLRCSLPKAATNSSLENVVLGQPATPQQQQQQPMAAVPSYLDVHGVSRAAALTGSRKRLCRTTSAGTVPTTATFSFGSDLQHPSMSGLCGPGMWQGILN